jgi:hypothetical protein
VCIVRVDSALGGLFDSSDAGFSIGLVLQILILASSPPVAMREPSGWTWTEKMQRCFEASLLAAESLWATQAGFVKRMDGGDGRRRCQ